MYTQIERLLREKRQDFHIQLDDPHQGNTRVYHPEGLSNSTSAQRAADDQFPLLHSFSQGELGHKSPLGFRGIFSLSSTPGLSPHNSSFKRYYYHNTIARIVLYLENLNNLKGS